MSIEWKEVNPDYIVSSDGQVKSRKRGRLTTKVPVKDPGGYLFVGIWAGGSVRLRYIHVLVAEAFIGPKPTPKHEVNHKNGVRSDNRDGNLEWVTRSQNSRHRYDVLKHGGVFGEANGSAKLTGAAAREIRSLREAGETQQAIADKFGVRQSCISDVILGKTWAMGREVKG